MSINRFVGVGRLTRDVDLRYSKSGVAVASFTVAINRPFKSQDGQDADFINCVTFRKPAENTAQYTKKGSLVGIDGRLQSRTYEDKDGKTIYVTEVVADSVQFLESKKESEQGKAQPNQDAQASNNLYANQSEPIDILDDDLPF